MTISQLAILTWTAVHIVAITRTIFSWTTRVCTIKLRASSDAWTAAIGGVILVAASTLASWLRRVHLRTVSYGTARFKQIVLNHTAFFKTIDRTFSTITLPVVTSVAESRRIAVVAIHAIGRFDGTIAVVTDRACWTTETQLFRAIV